MNAGERPAEDRRNALYVRAQQNSAAARLTMHFGVAAGLTAVNRRREREGRGGRRVHAGKERPRARAAVSFRCIIFSFATSRIHKKHVQQLLW